MSNAIFCPGNFSLNALEDFKLIFRRLCQRGSHWILVLFKKGLSPAYLLPPEYSDALPFRLRKYLHVCLRQFGEYFCDSRASVLQLDNLLIVVHQTCMRFP